MADNRDVQASEAASSHEREWVEAEQVERIELLQSQVESLEAERERLKTELLVARSWVRELGRWLDEAQGSPGRHARAVTKPDDLMEILAPRTSRLLRETEKEPIDWGKVAVVSRLVLLPWAILGALAYLIYALAA